ncbi:hypothetical protein RU97_GL000422 [Enterococcus canis]|uniref:Shikimate kinase n=1 Tax=Enterococcus canis TaxID=214095 RepID=A0A1L8RK96_9ENTE|nr:hypothetical protein [Enterococcus canis]OJG20189.1 hypothetical protein RU97_GL000422 [Enterococcus canis]
MGLIVLMGAQAVGKMTVGKALTQQLDAKLLYNHQTIDPFATFLGYSAPTFQLSDWMRKELFQAFATHPELRTCEHLIFSVLINFDDPADKEFLADISNIFLAQDLPVYFVELVADLNTRLHRNTTSERLAAKPSKRDIEASQTELLTSHATHRLVSLPQELTTLFPQIPTYVLDNSQLTPTAAATAIASFIHRHKNKSPQA